MVSITSFIADRPAGLRQGSFRRRLVGPLSVLILVLWPAPAPADDYDRAMEAWIGGDTAAALELLEPLAEDGDARAQLRLGELLESIGESEQAVELFTLAVDQGSVEARTRLGDVYRMGRGLPPDVDQAVALYRAAADDGWSEAEYKLGVCHETGYGMGQDYAMAAVWYGRAARQGESAAQYRLANLYFFGLGVPENPQQALGWYRRAARQGERDAILHLRLLGDFYPPLPGTSDVPPPVSRPGRTADSPLAGALSYGARVQLAAFRDQYGAASGWQQIRAAYPDLLEEFEPEFVAVDLGPAKGMYVRLLVGPFADRAAAGNLCARIKERNGDCLVVVRSDPL